MTGIREQDAAPAPKNARFWGRVNGGDVKITLRPGQSLRHGAARFSHDGARVVSRSFGRTLACPLDRLAALTMNMAPPHPDWREQGVEDR